MKPKKPVVDENFKKQFFKKIEDNKKQTEYVIEKIERNHKIDNKDEDGFGNK